MPTVVAQPYNTAGNGGRKLVRLSNGWEVAVTKTTNYFYFYADKKDGNGFVPLCHIHHTAIVSGDIALSNRGTVVHAIFTQTVNNEVRLVNFDATNVANTNIYSTNKAVDINQTAMGNVTLAIDPINGNLHAAWVSKNATHPNSFNIRYAKSTDGGVTWSAVTQVSYQTQSPSIIEPSIVVLPNGRPNIIARYNGGPSQAIQSYYHDGTGFASVSWNNLFDGKGYVQSNPSAVVDKNGVIHVAWHGASFDSNSFHNIYYSKSANGGSTWTTPEKVMVAGTSNGKSLSYATPSITTDKTGDLFIAFSGETNLAHRKNGESNWVVSDLSPTNLFNFPSTLYDPTFAGTFGSVPAVIYEEYTKRVEYIGTYTTNQAPTVKVTSPTANRTLYENDTLNITGTVQDADIGNTVTVRYQIGAGTVRAIKAFLSTGSLEEFGKTLTFKGGNLYDGDTLIARDLADGVAHSLKVWATDDKDGSSVVAEHTFYVVPNRVPLLTVNTPVTEGNIDADLININGTFSDPDANNAVVSYRINGGNSIQIAEGVSGVFDFTVSFGQLKIGDNIIVIEVIDSYGAKTSKTIKLHKKAIETPLMESTQRYQLLPPSGSAVGVLFYIQRDAALDMDVSISMTQEAEAEQYTTLEPITTAPVSQGSGIVEDEYYHAAPEPAEKILLQIDFTRTSLTANEKIYVVMGAFE